jgi:hypothetical protein
MAMLEGRLFPGEEETLIRPAIERLPADWRVQIVRNATSPVFEVRVLIPPVGTETKTFGDTPPENVVRFLEDVWKEHRRTP